MRGPDPNRPMHRAKMELYDLEGFSPGGRFARVAVCGTTPWIYLPGEYLQ